MPEFSLRSLHRLDTCDAALQEIFREVIKTRDIAVICGYRDSDAQMIAFETGKSRAMPGESKHNVLPSLAIDVAPSPIDWDDLQGFRDLAAHVQQVADAKGIKIKWGGDFKSIKDYDHFEIAEGAA